MSTPDRARAKSEDQREARDLGADAPRDRDDQSGYFVVPSKVKSSMGLQDERGARVAPAAAGGEPAERGEAWGSAHQ